MGVDSREETRIYCLHLAYIQILMLFSFFRLLMFCIVKLLLTLFVFLMLWPEAETEIYLYMLVELHTVLIYKCRDAIS